MDDFEGKVAVVTGAASGIGAGLAKECAARGMKVVLADVDESGLGKVERRLRAMSVEVLSAVVDVSRQEEVDELASAAMEAFGAVHLLVNNAGVVGGGTPWESTENDWDWVLGVNLMGVVHGVRSFVPIMIDQSEVCHIVNNSSATGLVPYSLSAPYQVSKHGVVSLSEHLYYSLGERAEHIGVSVLCSAWVATRILNAGRNRPSELANAKHQDAAIRKAMRPYGRRVRQAVKDAIAVDEVVAQVFSAIEANEFYVLPHAELVDPLLRDRVESILERRSPPDLPMEELLFFDGGKGTIRA